MRNVHWYNLLVLIVVRRLTAWIFVLFNRSSMFASLMLFECMFYRLDNSWSIFLCMLFPFPRKMIWSYHPQVCVPTQWLHLLVHCESMLIWLTWQKCHTCVWSHIWIWSIVKDNKLRMKILCQPSLWHKS